MVIIWICLKKKSVGPVSVAQWFSIGTLLIPGQSTVESNQQPFSTWEHAQLTTDRSLMDASPVVSLALQNQ